MHLEFEIIFKMWEHQPFLFTWSSLQKKGGFGAAVLYFSIHLSGEQNTTR